MSSFHVLRRLAFHCRITQVNLVAGKARNYAWASYASGSKLPVVRGKEVSAGSTDGMASHWRSSSGRRSMLVFSRPMVYGSLL